MGKGSKLRGWLLEQGPVEVAMFAPAEVENAEALALCNAVRGILPVASLGARSWAPSAAADGLRAALAQAFPGFARERE